MKARVEITLHRERQELELGWGARCQRAWEEFGMGGGENDGTRPPRGRRGSLKNGVLTTSVGDHEVGLGSSALTEPVSPSPIQAMGIKTALPAAELGLYSLVLSGALAYAGRGLLEASRGNSWALGRGLGPFSWRPPSSNQQGQTLRGSRPRVFLQPWGLG